MREHNKPPRVLICPLDWGLGHATRCIPIIDELTSQGADVIIAADGFSGELLKDEYPELEFIPFRGYRISFSAKLPLILNLVLKFPSLVARIVIEHYRLAVLIREYDIDIVISDNRYGLWNKEVFSVFITHQPNIIPPPFFSFTSSILRAITRLFIRRFDECWIPDSEDKLNLSGTLSHGYPLPSNTQFIGLLSRFEKLMHETDSETQNFSHYDIVAIISGPEPQRSQLESLLTKQLCASHLKSILLRGIAGSHDLPQRINNLTIVNHMKAFELCTLLMSKPVVICRGGYSTLMDLSFTGNKLICIPTPGQTEQEYLCKTGGRNNYIICTHENTFSLSDSLKSVNQTNGISITYNATDYKFAITRMMDKVRGVLEHSKVK